jgi:hypothetical protein
MPSSGKGVKGVEEWSCQRSAAAADVSLTLTWNALAAGNMRRQSRSISVASWDLHRLNVANHPGGEPVTPPLPLFPGQRTAQTKGVYSTH